MKKIQVIIITLASLCFFACLWSGRQMNSIEIGAQEKYYIPFTIFLLSTIILLIISYLYSKIQNKVTLICSIAAIFIVPLLLALPAIFTPSSKEVKYTYQSSDGGFVKSEYYRGKLPSTLIYFKDIKANFANSITCLAASITIKNLPCF